MFRSGGVVPAVVAGLIASVALVARPTSQTPVPAYALIAANGRQPLPFRSAGTTDMVALDQLASFLDFRLQEDPQASGLTVLARGQRVLLTPGQALVSVGGRIVSLSGPVVREGQTWYVPVDFLSRALGPAMNLRIDVRRSSHLILVGDLRVPQLTPRFERQGPNGRLIIDVQPPTAHHVTREGSRLAVRFEADALDAGSMAAAPPEFVAAPRVEGTSFVVDLGPAASTIRSDDTDPAHVTVDLLATAAPPAGRSSQAAEAPPSVDSGPQGVIRTVVIDPGHGGDDAGTRGAGGTVEKDLTLLVARRLKVAIESRVGLRVLLTRDADETLSVDRRTALANNNKADLLVSLHANASLRPTLRGAQVLSLSLDDYKDRTRQLPRGTAVPVAGGGTRIIDAVPWDLAQIPHAGQSATLSAVVARHLTEQHVTMYTRAVDQAPLRVLVGANMPAVLVELGFLSNADDERALTSGDVSGAIVDALVAAILEIRAGIPAPAGARR